jgi:hypothetical protein
MDQNLEKLISIGDSCMQSQYYSLSTILYCTSKDSLTVQDLVDLKRFRAAEIKEAVAASTNTQSTPCSHTWWHSCSHVFKCCPDCGAPLPK